MGNFFNYITKPIKPEEVDILFRANNVIREKMELYSDFTLTLNILVVNTYLGEIDTPKETKINLTDLFEMSKTNTKADLDTLISIYKLMDNSIEN
mgnify:CR=1 FL=1